MSEQKKSITEIILHKQDGLTQRLIQILAECNGKSQEELQKQFSQLKEKEIPLSKENYEAFKKELLEVDKNAVGLTPYDAGILSDVNRGHWDIYRRSQESSTSIVFKLPNDEKLEARSPLLDVKSGTVAIDFGTKSTVAGFINEKSIKQLIRIGKGNRGLETQEDYENPTIIEFINIDDFMQQYNFCKSRPFTSFNDICVSHTAQTNLETAQNEDFYRFFANLKQWAGTNDNKIRIKDKHKTTDLKDFAECGEKDLNPIELYAYYIGRYINNMTDGIYLEYLISYPVKYPQVVREKLQESFERGIKKSIPYAVLCESACAKRFKVEMTASEPAAYAVSALGEYGFRDRKKLNKPIHYGIFDFGGGTTDFDFGIWRISEKAPRYAFDIKHFGEGGDPHLGGENLLALLAQEVVEANKKELIEEGFPFIKSVLKEPSGGSERLFIYSQEARRNTATLIEKLRVIWERTHLFKEESDLSGIDEEVAKKIKTLKDGEFSAQLVSSKGESKNFPLKVEIPKLLEILKERVNEGVEKFYHSFKLVAERMDGLETLHIFLGGNSSRSVFVQEAFEALMAQKKEEGDKTEFILYPPLGTQEAELKLQELGLEVKEAELSRRVTCKTGVVFGLLDSRKTSKINVIHDQEEKFQYFIGDDDGNDNFSILIDKNKIEIGSQNYETLFPYANDIEYEIYFTKDTRAITNELPLQEACRLTLTLDKEYGENDCICIRATGLDTFVYAVWSGDECLQTFDEIQLKETKN